MIPSSSTHVEVNGGYLSFLMAEEYSIVYIDHSFLIHSSFDGHRGSIRDTQREAETQAEGEASSMQEA